jgi:hypothetical protein
VPRHVKSPPHQNENPEKRNVGVSGEPAWVILMLFAIFLRQRKFGFLDRIVPVARVETDYVKAEQAAGSNPSAEKVSTRPAVSSREVVILPMKREIQHEWDRESSGTSSTDAAPKVTRDLGIKSNLLYRVHH